MLGEPGDAVLLGGPPGIEGGGEGQLPVLEAGVGLDALLEVARSDRSVQLRAEVVVALVPLHQQVHGVEAVGGEQLGLGRHLRLGHPAQQVGPHVLGLGRRGVVGIAADVEVVVVLGQLGVGHHGGERGDVGEPLVGVDDLLDVLGLQVVLRPAGPVLGVGVDEEHLALALGWLCALGPQHQDAGGDAGAVEEVGGQADDGVEQVVLDEALADVPLGPAPEQHAVGHDGADHPVLAQHRDACAGRT